MNKIWLIARTTYTQRVRSGMFLILTFGLPLLMIIAGALPILSTLRGGDVPPLGFVDETGQLPAAPSLTVGDQTVSVTPYASAETAAAALAAGDIGGYLQIPADYFSGGFVVYFAPEVPGPLLEEALAGFLQEAQVGGGPEWVLERLQDPARYTYVASSGETVSEGPGLIIRIAAPAALAIAFMLAVLFGTTQMGSAIIREKDQRAMEMVVTSLRPRELVLGKVLGLSLLTLTQFAIWGTGALLALYLAFADELQGQSIALPWDSLMWGIFLIIPGYLLFATLAAGLGIIAGDSQQAQQLAGIAGIAAMLPIWLLAPIVTDPASSFSVGLTLFPLTAPSVALARMALTEVPFWQLAAALAILLATLALTVWAVARIFRVAMLTYGQSLNPKQLWRALAGA